MSWCLDTSTLAHRCRIRVGASIPLLSSEFAQRRCEEDVRGGDPLAVERPTPPEIIRQVTAGYAAKTDQPATHAAVVRVDVLYVQGKVVVVATPSSVAERRTLRESSMR